MQSFLLSSKLKISFTPGYIKIEGPYGVFIKETGDLQFNLVETAEGSRIFITDNLSNNETSVNISRLYNLIQGASQGFRRCLRIVGVGFRSTLHTSTTNKDYRIKINHIKGYIRKRVSELPFDNQSAHINAQTLGLKIGYSYESRYPLSQDKYTTIRVSRIESRSKGTLIYLQSNEISTVTQIAAEIRSFRVPDIYKGKGIYYQKEKIKLKKGKRQG